MKIAQVVELSKKLFNEGNATNGITNDTKRKAEPVEITERPVKNNKGHWCRRGHWGRRGIQNGVKLETKAIVVPKTIVLLLFI